MRREATPVTKAVAWLVPVISPNLFPGIGPIILNPGAVRWTELLPKFEKGRIFELLSWAATLIILLSL